jgi:hypothetical protein
MNVWGRLFLRFIGRYEYCSRFRKSNVEDLKGETELLGLPRPMPGSWVDKG